MTLMQYHDSVQIELVTKVKKKRAVLLLKKLLKMQSPKGIVVNDLEYKCNIAYNAYYNSCSFYRANSTLKSYGHQLSLSGHHESEIL